MTMVIIDPSKTSSSDKANVGKSESPPYRNEYNGYTFNRETDVDRIDVLKHSVVCRNLKRARRDARKENESEALSLAHAHQKSAARHFFEAYIAQRKPCLLDGHPAAAGLISTVSETTQQDHKYDVLFSQKKWKISRTMMDQAAGHEIVQVEQRGDSLDTFGKPRTSKHQKSMKLTHFLSKICQGGSEGELLYLSPQQSPEEEEFIKDSRSRNDVPKCQPFSTTPCRQLIQKSILPKHLPIAGHLIPHACNMWMGTSREGASSGLHHDYHDNFYIVLQGTKRIRLYPPNVAPRMYTYGKLHCIHANGRISYVGSETRADGVPLDMLSHERVHEGADQSEHKSQCLNKKEDDEDEEEDDEEEEEEEVVLGKGHDYTSSDDDEGMDWDKMEQLAKAQEENYTSDNDQEQPQDHQESQNTTKKSPSKIKDQQEETLHPPDNFSFIPPLYLSYHDLSPKEQQEVQSQFPAFAPPGEGPPLSWVVEVKAGQCLYMPAGWFHEVTSLSCVVEEEDCTARSTSKVGESDTEETMKKRKNDTVEKGDQSTFDETKETGLEGCHVAVNYWYHPPDCLHRFDRPYQDDFWKRCTVDL